VGLKTKPHRRIRVFTYFRGWALCFRRNKKVAAVAIARKLTVACWYLLQGRFSSLEEIDQTLQTKIHKLATAVGRQGIKALVIRRSPPFQRKNANCSYNQLDLPHA
jgi:hypothetical protein